MNRFPIVGFFILLIVRTEAQQASSPPISDSKWSVFAECQMIVLPQKAALPLIAEFSDDEKADSAWAKLQALLVTGAATLAGDLIVKGVEEKQLVSQTGEELRYPTEFEPPSVPEKIPEQNGAEALKAWPVVGVPPTAYEARLIGESADLSVHVSQDGQWLAADAVLQHVRFLRWAKFDAGRLANGEHLEEQQPTFHSMKSTLTLRLRNGQKALVGLHKVPDAENMFELFLLRMSAKKIEDSK